MWATSGHLHMSASGDGRWVDCAGDLLPNGPARFFKGGNFRSSAYTYFVIWCQANQQLPPRQCSQSPEAAKAIQFRRQCLDMSQGNP